MKFSLLCWFLRISYHVWLLRQLLEILCSECRYAFNCKGNSILQKFLHTTLNLIKKLQNVFKNLNVGILSSGFQWDFYISNVSFCSAFRTPKGCIFDIIIDTLKEKSKKISFNSIFFTTIVLKSSRKWNFICTCWDLINVGRWMKNRINNHYDFIRILENMIEQWT